MNEFKTIPNAPDYEVNSEKEIRRVENKKAVFVLNGGKVLLKTADGGMDHFIVEELVAQLFHNQAIEDKSTIITSENESNDVPMVLCGNCEPMESIPNCEEYNIPKYQDASPQKRGRGRPKKPVDPNAPVKVKGIGKRGRPAGSKNKPKQ